MLRPKGRKRTMIVYSPGCGALHFAWRDQNNQGSGPKITKSMALRYLRQNQDAASFRNDGYKVWIEEGKPVLVAPIQRINENTLMWKDVRYTYSLNDPENIRLNDPHNPMILYHLLDLKTKVDVGDGLVLDTEVKHLSTRHQICHFLAHEDALKKDPPVG